MAKHPRARAASSGALSDAVEVRPAATVAVMRDAPGGPETLLLRRPATAGFVPNALVFPGGRIEPSDAGLEWDRFCDVGTQAAADLLGTNDTSGAWARGFLVGALREVFEETGLLLGASLPVSLTQELHELRNGKRTFLDIITERVMVLKLSGLVPFGRRVTPAGSPKRYQTFFFAARAPRNMRATAAVSEVSSLEWVRPQDALRRPDDAVGRTLGPTRAALKLLDGYPDVDTLLFALTQLPGLDPLVPVSAPSLSQATPRDT
jgi:8-oxo-dGTP pyrophosphatase MutT (NUDIX family)